MDSETVHQLTFQGAEQRDDSRLSYLIIFFAAHLFLGLLMTKIGTLATLHVLVTVVIGIYCAVLDNRIERVAYVGGFMIGAEVLWRMSGARTFWETGKYAI